MTSGRVSSEAQTREDLRESSARLRRVALGAALAGAVAFVGASPISALSWFAPSQAFLARAVVHVAIFAFTSGGILAAHFWLLGQHAHFQRLSRPLPPLYRVIAWSVIAFVIVISALGLYYTGLPPNSRWK